MTKVTPIRSISSVSRYIWYFWARMPFDQNSGILKFGQGDAVRVRNLKNYSCRSQQIKNLKLFIISKNLPPRSIRKRRYEGFSSFWPWKNLFCAYLLPLPPIEPWHWNLACRLDRCLEMCIFVASTFQTQHCSPERVFFHRLELVRKWFIFRWWLVIRSNLYNELTTFPSLQ